MGRHWIITNRRVVRDPDDPAREIVDEASRQPQSGFRLAEFHPDRVGKRLNQDAFRRAVEFVPDATPDTYEGVLDADEADLEGSQLLFRALYDDMANAGRDEGDTLVVIHGFNYAWTDSLAHLLRLIQVYVDSAANPVSQIVYFSWPSAGLSTRYPTDQAVARPSGQQLGRVFTRMLQFYRETFRCPRPGPVPTPPDADPAPPAARADAHRFCGRRIHLAAHSMGNQVLEEFMRAVREYRDLRASVFGEVLLLNPDADWTALEPGRPLSALPEYADRIHLYNHHGDDALLISETTKNNEKRLGRHGPKSLDPQRLAERTLVVDCSGVRGGRAPRRAATGDLGEARDALGDATVDLLTLAERVLGGDAPNLRERLFDHWGYLHRPEVVADVYAVLRGESSSQIKGREHRAGPLFVLQDR